MDQREGEDVSEVDTSARTARQSSAEPATEPVTEPAAGAGAPTGPSSSATSVTQAGPVPPEGPADPAAVPPDERPLDPRAIARASLLASNNASLWWVSSGVVVATLLALLVGAPVGVLALAAVTGCGAVVRLVRPEPGPVAVSVRARWLDVAMLSGATVALAALAIWLPGSVL